MKIRSILFAVAGLALAGLAPAHADPATTAPSASGAAPSAEDPAKPVDHSQDVICKRVEVTGSHMAKERVCKTRKLWAAEAQDDEDNKLNEDRLLENRNSTLIPR